MGREFAEHLTDRKRDFRYRLGMFRNENLLAPGELGFELGKIVTQIANRNSLPIIL
jgi:hypothetical protein